MALILERPATRQPAHYAPASGKWLRRGLVALFDQRHLTDVVSGARASANTGVHAVTVDGVSLDYSGTANTQYAHRPEYATTGPFTIVSLFDVDAHTNFGALIAKQGTTTRNAPYELRIGPAAAGDSRINLLRASAAASASKVISGTNLIPNVPAPRQLLIVTGSSASIGTSGEYWINGVGATYTGAGGGDSTDNSSAVWIGRRYDGATQLDGRIYFVALFNRAVTAAEARDISANPWQLFESRRIVVPEASSGPGAQTLTATRFDNAQSFYSATVTPGAVTLAPARFDNTQTFYAATVEPGAVTLSPGLFSNTQTFYAATVTQPSAGTQNLTASLFSNTSTFYAATVSPGAVTLAAARFDNAQTFYAPTLTPGSVTLTPGLFTNAQTFYAASVYDPATLAASSIRFDISTGRIVKIINASVVLSF